MGNKLWQWVSGILAVIFITSSGLVTYTDLFSALFELKGVSYNYTGEIVSHESVFKPEIWINTSYWEICFDDYNGTKYDDYGILFKKRSYSRTLHVNMDMADNIITTYRLSYNGTWESFQIPVQWNVPTWGKKWRPVKGGDCWRRSGTNKIQLVFNISDDRIYKWSFNLNSSEAIVDIDPLLSSYSKEEIVKESKIVELDDVTKCLYRTYENPTKDKYCFNAEGVSNKISGFTLNTVTEIYTYRNKIYFYNVCENNEKYSNQNKTFYNETVCREENKTVKEYYWKEVNELCWDSKESIEFRRCYIKPFNLDEYLIEDHLSAFGYSMEEYTIIGSSGFNQTIAGTIILDDFDDASFDTALWNKCGADAGLTETGSRVQGATTGTSVQAYRGFKNTLTNLSDQIIRFNFTNSNSANNYVSAWLADGNDMCGNFQSGTRAIRMYWPAGGDITCQTMVSGGTSNTVVLKSGASTDVYYIAELLIRSDNTLMCNLYDNDGVFIDGQNISGFAIEGDSAEFGISDWTGDSGLFRLGWIENSSESVAVYGPFNSTPTFNQTNITSDCSGDSNYINISQNSSTFEETSSVNYHNWSDNINGFYLEVDESQCSWIFLEVGNQTITGFVDNPPNISQIVPLNNSIETTSLVTFKVNVSDDFNISNVSIYINNKINTTNVSGDNGVNYTEIISFTTGTANNWTGEVCDAAATPQCTNTSTLFFNVSIPPGPSNLTILLDGLNLNRTYEFGTTANLTLLTNDSSNGYCLNISLGKFGNNFVCNSTNMTVLLTLDFLEHINLSDGTESHSFNFSDSNDTIGLLLWNYDDNDGDFLFSIHTTDDPVYNLTISTAGTVISRVKEYYQGNFSILNFSSNGLETESLFFPTAGVQTFGFDYSVISVLPNSSNCTFQIFGEPANPEPFRFYEGFLTDNNFESYTNDKDFTWIYENFTNTNTESNFIETETSGGNPSKYCAGALNDYEYSDGKYTVFKQASCVRPKACSDSTSYSKVVTSTTFFDNSNIDFQDYDYIKIIYIYTITSRCNTFQGSPYCTNAGGSASTFARLGIRDSNGAVNYILDKENSISCGANERENTITTGATNTIILNKTENATQFSVYVDDVFSKVIPFSSSLTYGFYAAASGTSAINSFGSSSGISSNTISSIEFGGIGLNLSGDSDFYTNITNFTSSVLKTFTDNIISVYLRSTEFKPSGSTINYFINNISAVPDTSTLLSGANNSIVLRIDIDKGSSIDTDMPHVIDYNINVFDTAPINVSIDIGGDNVFEINLTGELNETTSPQNITFICSELEDDITTFCDKSTEVVCRDVPIGIKIANEGTVNATSFNITFDTSQNNIDYREILDLIMFNPTLFPLQFNATGGTLNISNISIPYTGNGKISLRLYNTSVGAINEKTIDVRFTDFNRSFPSGISYYEPIASSINDKNVEPFGQDSTDAIYNITMDSNLVSGSVFIKLNETSDSCWKIWVNDIYSNNSGENLSVLTNTTINITTGNNRQQNIWSWINLTGCSPSVYFYFDPIFEWFGLCDGCVETFDWNSS